MGVPRFRPMEGFPPGPDGQVTLANWRVSPFSRWALHHVREIIPSADIPNDPAGVSGFRADPVDLADLRIDAEAAGPMSLSRFLDATDTDGIVVADRGRIVFERYANGMRGETPHILMSVSKSLLGLLAGVLAAGGDLAPDRPVTDYVPEVAGTAYRGATVQQLLDMRAGIAFDEDYLATSGPIVAYRKATNRDQWYVQEGEAPMLFGVGIHEQHLFVDRVRGIVIAKVSSQAVPLDRERIGLTVRAAAAIRGFLAGAMR